MTISGLDEQANRQTTVDCARAVCSGWSGPMKESESELSALSAAAAAAAAIRSKPNTQSAAVAASPSPSLPVILKPHFAITLTKALIKTRRNKGRRRGGRGTEPAEGMREGECGSAGSRGRKAENGIKEVHHDLRNANARTVAADDASRVSERQGRGGS